jgi:acetyl-CoA carboxylase carboxyl transferase subunit beta
MPSRARITGLADPHSFREFNRKLVSVDPLKFVDRKSYRERLKEARRETGVREAVTTGFCRMGGCRAALVVFDFEFLGGTMGSAVGEKVAQAFEVATRRKLPLISVAASGGARVQEGMLSLLQMAKVSAAASLHDRAGLPFVSILADPTFGGVTPSFASLGDVIIAEPSARIGFAGPRVIHLTTGVPPPEGSHRAETLLRAGLIDLIVPRPDLRETVAYLIAHLRRVKVKRTRLEQPKKAKMLRRVNAWEEVRLARLVGRPTARFYISQMTKHFLELHGDRQGDDDPAVIGGLGELDEQTVMVIGQERAGTPEDQKASSGGMVSPGGYRKSLRLMKLAAKFLIPVVTLVDSPGAESDYEAEQQGIAHALACNLAAMASLPTPIVSVIVGEGGSGGALALSVGDRVLMLEHAIFSVISPEGAAAIIYKDAASAEALSERLKLTARDLLKLDIIDVLIPEPAGGAHLDPVAAATAVKGHILAALGNLRRLRIPRLLERRYKKYRNIGRTGVYWRELVRCGIRDGLGVLTRVFPRKSEAIARGRVR